jgi:hypothetical protein
MSTKSIGIRKARPQTSQAAFPEEEKAEALWLKKIARAKEQKKKQGVHEKGEKIPTRKVSRRPVLNALWRVTTNELCSSGAGVYTSMYKKDDGSISW